MTGTRLATFQVLVRSEEQNNDCSLVPKLLVLQAMEGGWGLGTMALRWVGPRNDGHYCSFQLQQTIRLL